MRIRRRIPSSQLIDDTGVLVRPGWLLAGLCLAAAAKAIEPPFEFFYPPSAAPFGAGWSLARFLASSWAVILVVFLLGGGILGDLFGRRRVLLWGLAIMLLANLSLLSFPNTLWHVLWRVMGHFSAGVVLPLTLAPIYIFFEGRQRAIAFAVYLSIVALAGLLSTFQGRLIVQVMDWQGVYLIPGLLTLASFIIVRRSLPESHSSNPHLVEIILYSGLTILVLGVIFGILELSLDREWQNTVSLILSLALALGLGMLAWWARKYRDDPLRSRSIHPRHIVVLIICGVLLQIVLNSFYTLTYSYFRVGLNLDFSETLVAMSPIFLGTLVAIFLIARRWASQKMRRVLAAGMLLVSISIAWMALVAGLPYWMQVLPMAVFGISIIATKTVWTNGFFQVLIDRYIGLNAGMNSATLLVGGALGGVLSTELLVRYGQAAFVRQSTALAMSEGKLISVFKNVSALILAEEEAGVKDLALAIGNDLYAFYQHAFISGYSLTLLAIAILCFLALLFIYLGIRATLQYRPDHIPLNDSDVDEAALTGMQSRPE